MSLGGQKGADYPRFAKIKSKRYTMTKIRFKSSCVSPRKRADFDDKYESWTVLHACK